MYVYSPLKKKRTPMPADLAKAFEMADDSGKAHDARPLQSILMRIRSLDPRLRGHILTRKTGVSAFGWSIKPLDQKDDERARQATLRLRRLIDEVVQHQVQAPLYDAFCLQIAWSNIPGQGNVPQLIRRYRPVELDKVGDYRLDILKDSDRVEAEISLDLNVHLPEFIVDVSDDDERGGLLRSIVYHEILLHEMMIEWGNYNRKLKGIIQAITERDAEDEEIAAAKQAVEQAVKNNFFVSSKAIEFKVNEIVKGSGQSFREMVDQIQRDVCIGILGQANTAEVARGSGSRAALEVLNLIRADIHFDDLMRCERIINEQVLRHDFTLNFGTSEVPWAFSFDIPEEADFETRVGAIVQAYDSGLPLVSEEAYKLMNLTKPVEVGDVLRKESQGL